MSISLDQISRKPNVSAQAAEPAAVDRNFCGGKAPRPVPLISQGTRDSIKTQATVFGKTCGELARQFGISRCEVETILLQEMTKFAAAEYRRGYREGPSPSGPASALRPVLRRAA